MKKQLINTLAFVFLFSFIFPFSAHADVADAVAGYIAEKLLQLMSLLTGLGGIILNYVVLQTVVNMADSFTKIKAIDTTWSAIRDLANMGFIFVLLYTAIRTIFGAGDYKRTITNIVIAGVFVNFSLFFTKVVIDIANLLALTFYNAIAPNAGTQDVYTTGISSAIMQSMHITSLYKMSGSIGAGNLLTIGILGSIVLLIAAFIFFAIAILFIIRYIVLIIVLILSPIYFVAAVFPGGEGYKKQWESALIGQAFFAPVYFIMTWITLRVFNGMSGAIFPSGNTSMGDALQGSGTDIASVLVGFVVLIGFLIMSIVVSKNVANKTSKGFSKVTSWATGKAGAATFGMAGRLGRGTIGRGAQAIADDKDLQARALAGSMTARLQLATAQKTSKASFDLRGTGLNKNLDAGKAQTGGFAADNKKREERLKSLAKNVGSLSDKEKASNEAGKAAAAASAASARANLESATAKAREEAEKTIAKSAELVAAEKAEADAKRYMEMTDISPTEKARRQGLYEAAKTKKESLTKDHEEIKNKFVINKTIIEKEASEAAKAASDSAQKRNQGQERINTIVDKKEKKNTSLKKKKWQPSTDKVLLWGKIKREDANAPSIIRGAVKQKNPVEKVEEALNELKAATVTPPPTPQVPPAS